MAGGSGGAWKVAYADFVTAMMAFFLVMWITGQSKPVKQAVAQYFEDPLGTDDGSRSTSVRGPEDATTVGQFESGMGPGRSLAMANLKSSAARSSRGVSAVKPPRITISRDGEQSRSTGTLVTFQGHSNTLDEQARRRLTLLAPLLLGKPNLVEIRGRVIDPTPSANGDVAAEWGVSYARCSAVMRYLIEQGISPERLRLSQTGAREPFTLLPEEDIRPDASHIEVFALSEYARSFDALHDARVRTSEDRQRVE
ncbi:MAG: OmpA family protein [Planctomycetota bacterium]|nr:OmpA family protein [Planctomycetota bacterium]